MTRPFRFGVVLISEGCSRAEWVAKSRRAEELGYDVVAAPDHLNLTSPFPSVVLTAENTTWPRVGTYVLNAAFHNHTLLARDLATLDQFTDGRLEIGLGAGYVEWEFTAAGVPFGAPGTRVDRLVSAVTEIERAFDDPGSPKTVQRPRPPLLLAGHGDRVLRLAARHAEVVGLTGAKFDPAHGRMTIATAAQMDERVAYVRACAGDRAGEVELNLLSKATLLTTDRGSAIERLRRFGPELPEDELLGAPTVLVGTPADVAAKLHEIRDRYGISYTTVMENSMENFGKVIEAVR
ncbi:MULTISPECIES: TIGR03621 family F420-dependent LLM class oxidoreductase [Amycolatopsis]|uniref:TIGR03621 family F420-dependent LLM class oxidoreductase n=1 Tax=Amycolatopsis TaxID=1813 RepID=UPI00174CF89B|nr:TIGR03621 family F420-dependent LLM class oxidoreductase [Amycolatopsis bullii]